jgi:hypothetical protein
MQEKALDFLFFLYYSTISINLFPDTESEDCQLEPAFSIHDLAWWTK